jgi:hypothetical protein
VISLSHDSGRQGVQGVTSQCLAFFRTAECSSWAPVNRDNAPRSDERGSVNSRLHSALNRSRREPPARGSEGEERVLSGIIRRLPPDRMSIRVLDSLTAT